MVRDSEVMPSFERTGPTETAERLDVVNKAEALCSSAHPLEVLETDTKEFIINEEDSRRSSDLDDIELLNHQSIQSLNVEDLIEKVSTSMSKKVAFVTRRSRKDTVLACGCHRTRDQKLSSSGEYESCLCHPPEVILPALSSSTVVLRKGRDSSAEKEAIKSFHDSLCSLMSSSQSLSYCSLNDLHDHAGQSCIEFTPPLQPGGCGQYDGSFNSNSDVLILTTLSQSLIEQLSLSKDSLTIQSRLSNRTRYQDPSLSSMSPLRSPARSFGGSWTRRMALPAYRSPKPGTKDHAASYEPRAMPSVGELFPIL
jgi:hypothetical protein